MSRVPPQNNDDEAKSADPIAGEAYEVGYGKPPMGKRFKPGQSGNPKGRPRGDQNFQNLYRKELAGRVSVKDQGRHRRMSRGEVMVKRSVSEAMAGNFKHMAMAMSLDSQAAQALAEVTHALEGPADALVKQGLIRRLREIAAAAAIPTDAEDKTPEDADE